ncbi:MAG: DUF1624 domain-containing protein [Candidatus Lokiarchaeota archaeon]|nr:DUF1624 domain-containing protein [Candidatus Lokiarchaeota archaeon]
MTASPPRFKFLDFMKGLALLLILWAHLGLWWHDGSWTSIHTFMVIFFIRPFGPSNFIFASIFGLLLSVEMRENEGQQKMFRTRMVKRTAVFLVIGCILNLINISDDVFAPGALIAAGLLRVLLNCNIFTFLGIAQIAIYFARKINVAIQVALVALVFVSYYLVVNAFTAECNAIGVDYRLGDLFLSDISTPVAILYFLLMFENSMAPLVPYIALVFLVNIVYRGLIKLLAAPATPVQRDRIKAEMRRVAVASALISLAGVILGIMPSPGAINQVEYLNLINDDAYRIWNPGIGGFPLFLQPANPAYVLYSFGLVSLLVLGGTWLIDFTRRKWVHIDLIATFGSYSLTVFITHAVASFITIRIGLLAFSALIATIIVLYVAGIYFWHKRFRGRLSLEWFMRKFLATDFIQGIKARRGRKQEDQGDAGYRRNGGS